MKRAYETPSAERLEFNYTDVVVASGSVFEMTDTNQSSTYCIHSGGTGGYTFEDNHSCSKDPNRSKNKKCYA